MRGMNKVILVGNCGKEPEYRLLQDSTPVAKLTIATEERYKLQDGETKVRTDWHTIILWRGLASFANSYVKKGSLVCVEGKLRNREYTASDGKKKYVTEVVAEEILLLDKKQKGEIGERLQGDVEGLATDASLPF